MGRAEGRILSPFPRVRNAQITAQVRARDEAGEAKRPANEGPGYGAEPHLIKESRPRGVDTHGRLRVERERNALRVARDRNRYCTRWSTPRATPLGFNVECTLK